MCAVLYFYKVAWFCYVIDFRLSKVY